MQAMFAYEKCMESNYHLAVDGVREAFKPDMNSMDVQDHDLLKIQSKEALTLFGQEYANKDGKISKGSVPRIVDVVEDERRNYYSGIAKDFKHLRSSMITEAEKIFDRYLGALLLVIEIGRVSEQIEKVSSNFANNRFLKFISDNKHLQKESVKRGIKWDNEISTIRSWYRVILKKDEKFIEYQGESNPSVENDKEILRYVSKEIVMNHDAINSFFEERDLYWAENRAIVKSMISKTIKVLNADDQENFDLATLSYNWDEDREFLGFIFADTIKESKKLDELISTKTVNWDIERIAATDRVILRMAINEMIKYPGIPVKVTINEYIEICKLYSTPKSKQFVNGLLDVIAVDLQKEGVIKKSGRGLIDNK